MSYTITRTTGTFLHKSISRSRSKKWNNKRRRKKLFFFSQDIIQGTMVWKNMSSTGLSALSQVPTMSNVWLPRWFVHLRRMTSSAFVFSGMIHLLKMFYLPLSHHFYMRCLHLIAHNYSESMSFT